MHNHHENMACRTSRHRYTHLHQRLSNRKQENRSDLAEAESNRAQTLIANTTTQNLILKIIFENIFLKIEFQGVAHELISPEKKPALAYQPVRGGKTLDSFCLVFHESNELYSRNHH